VSPRLEHTLSLAALTQGTMRMLWRLGRKNQRWRIYDRFLVGENRWRAQRYGIAQGLIDFGLGRIVPFERLAEEWLAHIEEDACVLQSTEEIAGIRAILAAGTSADRQRALVARETASGSTRDEAMRSLVRQLAAEFEADL
jgi:carboxylate-amine ligase